MKNPSDNPVSLSEIMAARSRLNGVIARTPCVESAALSELTGAHVFCKQEFLQRTGSFKERGARNALAQLTPEHAQLGVIAASAGNHALGLAWHGRLLGIPVTVVMPRFAPLVKVARCRQFGATVILHGDTYDEARSEAGRLAKERQLTYIHPFNDPQVIAGQGTLAFEILEQVPDADAVIVPVGGGGLLAGMATVFHALKPKLQVIGVEPASAACFAAGLAAGTPVRIPIRATVADGLAVAEAGRNALTIMQPLAHRLVTVNEETLALAILRLAELEKCIIEGAGAAGLAAMLNGSLPDLAGRKVVLLLSGGNIDPLAHSRVIERGLAADGRIYRFDVLLSDRPGALAHLAGVLAAAGANVTEIVHNRTFAGPDLSRVHVLCTVETRDRDHVAELQQRLAENGVELVGENRLRPTV
ncbi:MAG TPA: threonine ammonia-lyase [Verrucomicrobiae bacterium]|jgi:threonine dehydratase